MVRGTLQNGARPESSDYGVIDQRNLLPNDHRSTVVSQAVVADDDDGDEISLQGVLSFLKRRAGIIGLVAAGSSLSLGAFILTQPPVFFGQFRLLVEPVTTGSQLAEDLTADTVQSTQAQTRRIISGGSESRIDYVSQIEVLRSEATLAPIVARIQTRYPEMTSQLLLSKVGISRPKETKLLDFTYNSLDPEEIKFVLGILSEEFIKYSIDDRASNLKEGAKFIDAQLQRQREELSGLEKRLSDLRARYGIVDPASTETLLNSQLTQLSTQAAQTKVNLSDAQTLYGNLRAQVGQDPGAAIALSSLSQSQTYQSLLLKLQEVDQKLAIESTRFTGEALELQVLRDQRQELMPLLQAEAARVMGVANPGSINTSALGFQGDVSRDLTQQLVNAANQVQVLTQQDQVLQSAINQINRQTQDLSKVAQEYLSIVREVELVTGSLNRLQIARENLQVESTRQAAPWKLISKLDENSIGVQGGKSKKLLLSLMLSGVFGLAAAWVAEQLDRVFHDVEELKEIPLPCLGVIPYNSRLTEGSALMASGVPDSTDALTAKDRQSQALFQESFYTLDANIRLLSSDSPIKSLTITSTSPADGKSTVSVHLAMAAVMMGRRVLLIDTDLRRPQVHHRFNVSNMQGLSNVLTSEVDFHDLLQEVPQSSGVSLLVAGPTPPSPGRLLSSRKMQSLIDQASEEFDLVICDAPPAIFADSKLTATHTDGVLMVIGINKTDRPQALQVIEEWNAASHPPVLGLIANGVRGQEMNSYYYQRYYNSDDRSGHSVSKKRFLSELTTGRK
jgi:polysaccharide biosynthesis transport protein